MKLTDLYNYQKTPVSSVNNKIGDVVLFASDVNAIDRKQLGVTIPLLKNGKIETNQLPQFPKLINGKIPNNYLIMATKNTAGVVEIGQGLQIDYGVLSIIKGEINSNGDGVVNIKYDKDICINEHGLNNSNGLVKLNQDCKIESKFISNMFYNNEFVSKKIKINQFDENNIVKLSYNQLKLKDKTIVQLLSSNNTVQNNVIFKWEEEFLIVDITNLAKQSLGGFVILKYLIMDCFDVDDVKKYSTIHTIELNPYSIEENQQGKYLLNVNVNDCTMVQIIDNNGCVRDDILLKWNYVVSPAHQVTLGIVDQNGDFQELSFDGTDSTPTNEIENVNEYYSYNSPQQNSSAVTTSQVNQNNYYSLQLDFTNIKQELQTEQNKTVWFLKYVVNFKIDRISKISNTNALIYG